MADTPEIKRQRAHAYNAALRELKRKHRTEWRRIYDRIWAEVSAEPVARKRQGGTWRNMTKEGDDDA